MRCVLFRKWQEQSAIPAFRNEVELEGLLLHQMPHYRKEPLPVLASSITPAGGEYHAGTAK